MKKWLIILALVVVGLPLLLIGFIGGAFLIANRTNGTLLSAGEQRKYLVYVPDSYDPSVPAPLVISLHGFVEWPAHQMQISGWNELADEYGFIVVYPSGTGFPLRWRTGGADFDRVETAKDVQFITDLIDQLSAEYNVDRNRIYANGLSNGGGMTMVLACELSERIAAVGSVAGAFRYPREECQPARPVPAILFHGTADPIVSYEGGPSRSFDIPFPSISEWVAELAQYNGCDSTPHDLPPSGTVSGIQYAGCAADVVFYTITGGGHSWPGGEPLPEWIAGTTSEDIDATRKMWEFFQEHPLEE